MKGRKKYCLFLKAPETSKYTDLSKVQYVMKKLISCAVITTFKNSTVPQNAGVIPI